MLTRSHAAKLLTTRLLLAALAACTLATPTLATAGFRDTVRCISDGLKLTAVPKVVAKPTDTHVRRYETFPLRKKFRGEEHGIRREGDDFVVEYFSYVKRQDYRVTFNADRKLIDAQNNLVSTGGRPAIFVMFKNGELYLTTEQQKGRIHHSSLSGGQAVAAAGEMHVHDGEIAIVNNKSGHYHPTDLALEQVAEELMHQKLDVSAIQFTSNLSGTEKKFPHLWRNPDVSPVAAAGGVQGDGLRELLRSGHWEGIELQDRISVIDFPDALIGRTLGEVRGIAGGAKAFFKYGPIREVKITPAGLVAEVELPNGTRQSVPLYGRFEASKYFLEIGENKFTAIKPTEGLPRKLAVGSRQAVNRVQRMQYLTEARAIVRDAKPATWTELFPTPKDLAFDRVADGEFNGRRIYGLTYGKDRITVFAGTLQRVTELPGRKLELVIVDPAGDIKIIALEGDHPEIFVPSSLSK